MAMCRAFCFQEELYAYRVSGVGLGAVMVCDQGGAVITSSWGGLRTIILNDQSLYIGEAGFRGYFCPTPADYLRGSGDKTYGTRRADGRLAADRGK